VRTLTSSLCLTLIKSSWLNSSLGLAFLTQCMSPSATSHMHKSCALCSCTHKCQSETDIFCSACLQSSQPALLFCCPLFTYLWFPTLRQPWKSPITKSVFWVFADVVHYTILLLTHAEFSSCHPGIIFLFCWYQLSNSVMHSDIFKAEEDWTKSQQNNWLLGLQVYTLYMKNDISVSTWWRSNLEPVHR